MKEQTDRVRFVRTIAAALLCALVASCAHLGQLDRSRDLSLKAMTFNIRVDVAADGENAWPRRKELVAALIRHEAPDVIGLQEVLLRQKRDLESALPNYVFLGVGRDNGKQSGEFAPLAYRVDRFELIDSGTFWLSPTPKIPSKGWDAAFPRVATWAVLREKETGKLLRALNTHFDHLGEQARKNSALLIGRWAAAGDAAGTPTIVMGDFNSEPGTEPYRLMVANEPAGLSDSRKVSKSLPYGPNGTFTGFNIEYDAPGPIDHIFVSREFAVESYAIITQHWGGHLPSDHYPVAVSLRLMDQ